VAVATTVLVGVAVLTQMPKPGRKIKHRLAVAAGVAVEVAVEVMVPVAVGEPGAAVSVMVGVLVAVAERASVALGVGLLSHRPKPGREIKHRLLVAEGVAVDVAVGVFVTFGVLVIVGVLVTVEVTVGVLVMVGVCVIVGVRVTVMVAVAVLVGVFVGGPGIVNVKFWKAGFTLIPPLTRSLVLSGLAEVNQVTEVVVSITGLDPMTLNLIVNGFWTVVTVAEAVPVNRMRPVVLFATFSGFASLYGVALTIIAVVGLPAASTT